MKRIFGLSLVLAMGLVPMAVSTAQAQGFGADLLRRTGIINEDQRKQLDDFHTQLGNPLDHAAAAATGAAATAATGNPAVGAAAATAADNHLNKNAGR